MKTFERLLFNAIHASDSHLAGLCCDAGADIHVRDAGGLAPLDAAVINGSTEIASMLLRRGADPRSVTRDGIGALGLASASNDVQMLRILAASCAGFEAPTATGKGCLQIAIDSGAEAATDYLLAHGADPNALDDVGNSLLQLACSLARPRLVAGLLENGANAAHRNFQGRTVLDDAIMSGVYRIASDIAKRLPVDAVKNALSVSSGSDHVDEGMPIHRPLVQKFGSTATRARLRAAVWSSQVRRHLRDLVSRHRGASRLDPSSRMIAAIEASDLVSAQYELDLGANPNSISTTGCPALVAAAQLTTGDEAAICQFIMALLNRGADPTVRNLVTGETALHAACRTSQTLSVAALLQPSNGRSVINASDHLLNRPLHLATAARHHEAIAELFRAGADMNPVNRDGYSPLHLAALANDIPTAEALLKHDANPRLRTGLGKSARQCIPSEINPEKFSALLDSETARRQRPSIFSSNHPLAALTTSPLARRAPR
jgi:ankyrin repeat protein